jgi:hypothetical protein
MLSHLILWSLRYTENDLKQEFGNRIPIITTNNRKEAGKRKRKKILK